jgi:hypothetical protein
MLACYGKPCQHGTTSAVFMPPWMTPALLLTSQYRGMNGNIIMIAYNITFTCTYVTCRSSAADLAHPAGMRAVPDSQAGSQHLAKLQESRSCC